MALKNYDFELRENLFHDVKVDRNFCLHNVETIIILCSK